MRIFYTIYKIINNLNGKVYFGQHQTKNLDDGYFGSGADLIRAIQEHGRSNFSKEILFIFDNFEDMNNKEAEIVTPEFVLLEDNYNMIPGGIKGGYNGWSHDEETRKRISESLKGRTRPPEVIEKMKLSQLKSWENKTFSDEMRKHLSTKNTGQVRSEETKRQMSESAKKRWTKV